MEETLLCLFYKYVLLLMLVLLWFYIPLKSIEPHSTEEKDKALAEDAEGLLIKLWNRTIMTSNYIHLEVPVSSAKKKILRLKPLTGSEVTLASTSAMKNWLCVCFAVWWSEM